MRSFPTLGFLSLVSALALVGCGDDEGDGNGNGGSAGGGTAGNAGDGGTGGMGGNGGDGGSSMAGNGGGGGASACTDCAELVMPFTAAGQNIPYRFNHAAPGLDYSTAVITWNIIVETPNANISVQPQLQNANPPSDFPGYYGAPSVALSAANFPAGMSVPITLNMATVAGPALLADAGADAGDAGAGVDPAVFDKTSVDALQLQFTSGAGLTSAFEATVYIDSVTVTNVTGFTGATFANGIEGLVLNTYEGDTAPDGTPMPVAR